VFIQIFNSVVRPQMRHDRKCTYKVTRRRVRATTVAVEKQKVRV